MEENLFQLFIEKGLLCSMYKELNKHPKKNNLINKWTNELNIQISKEVQMDNKYMKKCSASLAKKNI
jgi:hypothetical protein